MPLSIYLVFMRRASHLNTRVHPIFISQLPSSTPFLRARVRYVNGFSGPGPGQVGPQGEVVESSYADERPVPTSKWSPTFFKMFESAATTFASILVLA